MKDYCPDCNAELESYAEGICIGQICPDCGWSLITTLFPPIMEDETVYSVSLLPGNNVNKTTLAAISHQMGCNFVSAKQMIQAAPVTLFSGRAPDVLERINDLEMSGVSIVITPSFPYDNLGELKTSKNETETCSNHSH